MMIVGPGSLSDGARGEGVAGPGQPRGEERSDGHGWRSGLLGRLPAAAASRRMEKRGRGEIRKTLAGGGLCS